MKTQPKICQAFDLAIARLDAHGITVRSSDSAFHLFENDVEVGALETVDGLAGFIDGMEFALRGKL